MIACTACAKKNPDSATRCLECGAPLSPSFDLLKEDNSRSLWIGIAGVLVAGGLLAAYYVPKLSKPDAVESGKGVVAKAKPSDIAMTTLNTRGQADFGGVNFSVDCPLAWKAVPLPPSAYAGRSFQRPDSGLRDFMIVRVAPELPELPLTEDLFRRLVLELGAPSPLAPPDTKYTRKAFLEGFPFPCALLEFDTGIPESPDLVARNRTYMIFVQGRVVHVGFTRIGPRSKNLLDEWSELMTHVLHSIKLN